MHQHDKSSSTDVINTPGEADEEDGGYMVNYLLFEVLKGGGWGGKNYVNIENSI